MMRLRMGWLEALPKALHEAHRGVCCAYPQSSRCLGAATDHRRSLRDRSLLMGSHDAGHVLVLRKAHKNYG